MPELRNKLRAIGVRVDLLNLYARHLLAAGEYILHRLRRLLLNLLLNFDHMRFLQHQLRALRIGVDLQHLRNGDLLSGGKHQLCRLRPFLL